MTLGTKDIVYLLTYIITLITMLIVIRSLLIEIRKDMRLVKNIIFGERGALNIVTQAILKAHLDEIWNKMRRTDQGVEMILRKVEGMDKNILILMVHQGIKSPDIVNPIDEKKD